MNFQTKETLASAIAIISASSRIGEDFNKEQSFDGNTPGTFEVGEENSGDLYFIDLLSMNFGNSFCRIRAMLFGTDKEQIIFENEVYEFGGAGQEKPQAAITGIICSHFIIDGINVGTLVATGTKLIKQ